MVRTSTDTHVHLSLTEELYERMVTNAHAAGIKLEKYIEQQLQRFGAAPLESFYIPPAARRDMEACLGKNFRDGNALAAEVKKLVTINVADLPVRLQEKTIERLKSRCINQPDFRAWLEQQIQVMCDQFVGLR